MRGMRDFSGMAAAHPQAPVAEAQNFAAPVWANISAKRVCVRTTRESALLKRSGTGIKNNQRISDARYKIVKPLIAVFWE